MSNIKVKHNNNIGNINVDNVDIISNTNGMNKTDTLFNDISIVFTCL